MSRSAVVAMQSSPPQRAWDRPTSPTNSQYSLDLGALGLDSHSNESSPLPKPRVDRVLSEDIDGPSDFTLNMEKWMRGGGGTVGRGTMKGGRGTLQSLREEQQMQRPGDESVRRRRPDEELKVPSSPLEVDDEPTQSHHTPDHSPPKDSPWHERPLPLNGEEGHEDGGEHASSDWDPYDASNGTPMPPEHRQFLQPTVEDYYSELTPARPTPARVPSLRVATNTAPRQYSQSPHQSEPSTPGRPSSDTLSPVRSPTRSPERSPTLQRHSRSAPPAEVSSPFTEPPTTAGRELHTQFQTLQARCQQLESLNSALKQALDEEQRIRRHEKSAHEVALQHAAKRERELNAAREEASRRADGLEREAREQHHRTMELDAEIEEQKIRTGTQVQRAGQEMDRLNEELERMRKEHEQEVSALRRDHELTRRAKEAAEETARVHREELEEHRVSSDGELGRLRQEAQQAESARAAVTNLEAELRSAKATTNSLRAEKAAAEQTAATFRGELEAARHNENFNTQLTTNHQRAVESSDRLQTQLKQLRQQLTNEQTSHDEEIERLQSSHEGMLAALRAEHDAESNEHEAQQSVFNDAILERDAAQDNLASLQADLDATKKDLESGRNDISATREQLHTTQAEMVVLREQLKDSETVNAALDARVAEALRRRELYWRGRMEEGDRERKLLAKALMRQWGREEVGVTEPEQGYLYKYLMSGGGGGSPTKAGAA